MLNREKEYTYLTSTNGEVQNEGFAKNVVVNTGTTKACVKHGGLEEETEEEP